MKVEFTDQMLQIYNDYTMKLQWKWYCLYIVQVYTAKEERVIGIVYKGWMKKVENITL